MHWLLRLYRTECIAGRERLLLLLRRLWAVSAETSTRELCVQWLELRLRLLLLLWCLTVRVGRYGGLREAIHACRLRLLLLLLWLAKRIGRNTTLRETIHTSRLRLLLETKWLQLWRKARLLCLHREPSRLLLELRRTLRHRLLVLLDRIEEIDKVRRCAFRWSHRIIYHCCCRPRWL